MRQVLTVTCMPFGDGIDWTLREGGDKYDLTVNKVISLKAYVVIRCIRIRFPFSIANFILL